MGPALGYPWKGLFYLKPYKLKVSKVPIYPEFIGEVMVSLRSNVFI